MYRTGGCRTGPAGVGQAEQGEMTTLEPPATAPGLASPDFPWGKLFGVSVLAGLTISWLTKPKK